jgi:tRNA modification GTPase
MHDSIESAFAVLTPPGRGGIAVIRCVGPAVEAALAQCFRPSLPCPGRLAYGHVVGADERPIDEVILYSAGAIFEVNCHGGPAAVRAVCERLAAAGLPEVDADRLLEIEGLPRIVRDARRALRRAFTPLAARILLDQLNGALAAEIAEILAPLAAGGGEPYLAPGEYTGGGAREGASAADPPPVYSRGAKYAAAADALAAIDALLGRWRTCGRFIADPPRIAIAGRPNSGKSTLLNRLVGAERAITSAAAGTTRDYIEAEAAMEGAPVVLVDTAGLREPGGEIERQGIARAREELARAAVVIYLIDADEPAYPEDEAQVAELGGRALVVLSKIDSRLAASRRRARSHLAISALTGEGVAALAAAVLKNLGWRAPAAGEAVPFTPDQAAELAAAREALAAGSVDDTAARLKALLA